MIPSLFSNSASKDEMAYNLGYPNFADYAYNKNRSQEGQTLGSMSGSYPASVSASQRKRMHFAYQPNMGHEVY